MRRLVMVLAIPLVSVMTGACDYFTSYSVVNNTDKDLPAWIMSEPCSGVVGDNGDYPFEIITVPAGESVASEELYDVANPPKCVQVATLDRLLITSTKYDYGKTYVIGNAVVTGQRIRPTQDLPDPGRGESLGEKLQGTWSYFLGPLLLVPIFLFGAFLLVFVIPAAIIYLAFLVYTAVHDR